MNLGHGGNLDTLAKQAGCSPAELLDFSANMNPLGPPAILRPTIARALEQAVHYPDPDALALRQAAGEAWGISPEQIIAGNGSTELLYAIPRIAHRTRAILAAPCYIDYRRACEQAGLAVELFRLCPESNFAVNFSTLGEMLRGDELVILGRPNNPTGVSFSAEAFRSFAEAHPQSLFVIDEAFVDFTDPGDNLATDLPENTILLRSLTKFYAIPGIRLGLAVACESWIHSIREVLLPWSVGTLAQHLGAAILQETDYAHATRTQTAELRETLATSLRRQFDLTVFDGEANFLLCRLPQGQRACKLAETLLQHWIAIRVCDNYDGLDERYFRVAVRTENENAKLLQALTEILSTEQPEKVARPPFSRRTPSIMWQGCSSNAGKSVLAAGLCRILLQDGLRVAPFKSQNMSLNSFVTHDGGEMGRAQVTQARAAGLDPDVRMNPVLLKPNSETGSQIIVHGKPVGNMQVGEYIRYKPQAFQAAKESYDALAAEYDAIVLEGAGSPAEVNLKSHDIVNMGMARYAASPVLLAGDIDRGGIFASFVGTMEVMEPWERELVAGFVINRFRGDASLLGPAMDYTQNFTGKETLGIVPYIKTLGLPEEDSVEFKSGALQTQRPPGDHVEIAVIDLPHISNFTDIDPLIAEPDVYVHIVRDLQELGHPDAILLPGSKNTLSDLADLTARGLAEAIVQRAEAGCEIVGICGGYQMLGRRVSDASQVESPQEHAAGLGLLDLRTEMAQEKTLTLTTAIHQPSGCEVRGYEIHHGQSSTGQTQTIFKTNVGQACGQQRADGQIWGTYLHGLFDADEFRRWWIDHLRTRKNLSPLGTVQTQYNLEHALDRLADIMRKSMDIPKIYEVMGL